MEVQKRKKLTAKQYWKLFSTTFSLSAFTFGGGFVIIPLMKKRFVDELHWIEEEEMLNLAAIAQSAPGAVAVNAAILVGYRIGGLRGAVLTILGSILPPLLILSVITLFYEAFRSNHLVSAVLKGMQAGIAAVICDVVINMGSHVVKAKEWLSILLMVLAFVANFVLKINVMYIILVCAVIGVLRVLWNGRKAKGKKEAGE
jgi:chromate transporter